MKHYYVTTEEKCPKCNGNGILVHRSSPRGAVKCWKETCPRCHGQGRLTNRVPLRDALDEIHREQWMPESDETAA